MNFQSFSSRFFKPALCAFSLLAGAALACAAPAIAGYEGGTPAETKTGRVDCCNGSSVAMSVAPSEKTPDGASVLACKVKTRGALIEKEKWRGENLFSSVLYLNSPACMKNGSWQRVSIWVKSSAGMPFLLAFKDKAGYPAGDAADIAKKLDLKAGEWQKAELAFKANADLNGKDLFAQLWFGLLPVGQTFFAGPLEVEELKDGFALDLKPFANMDYKDEVAGDGKGGWSDQGPENDMRNLDFSQKDFGGIPFELIDPSKNSGKAVLTFKGRECKTELESAKGIAPAGAAGRYLYLLHTSCWNTQVKGSKVGELTIEFADGSKLSRSVAAGVDVADWWTAPNLENGRVVYKKMNGSAYVGLYLSKFDLGEPLRQVRDVEFASSGETVWILLGATISSKSVSLSQPPDVVIAAGKEWKAADMSDIKIKEGSALDLSALVGVEPAGAHGRVVVSPSGSFAFEDAPSVPRRFCGFVMDYWQFKVLFTYTLPGSTKEADIEEYARQVRLHGYNAVRLMPDVYLMEGSAKERVQCPERQDEIDRLVAALKKNGVYVYYDIAAYGLGFLRMDGFKDGLALKAKMMIGDAELRDRWLSCAKDALLRVNPYTGLAAKDDPAIFCIDFYNEQCTGVKIAMTDKIEKLDPKLKSAYAKKWSEWLAAKYGDFAKLAALREPLLNGKSSFSEIPIPNIYGNNPLAKDFHLFLTCLADENLKWCAKQLRDLGYNGLVTQYNSNPDLGCSSARWQGCQAISANSYHDHPFGNFDKDGQLSSVENAALTWRYANAWRFQDRPLVASEYNHAFWNKYRHEGGLLYPAYAALNGWGGILWHETAVDLAATGKWPRGGGINIFRVANAPLSRANAFLSLCLFARGDVAEAPHRVELEIPNSYLLDSSRSTVNSEQQKIGLLTKFSVFFPELKPADGVGTPSRANILLRPDLGATVVDGEWFSFAKEAKGAKFSIDAFAQELKKRGILPQGNLSDPAKGIYQSETGEITMRVQEKLIKAVTPRTEAVSLLAGKAEALKRLCVNASDVDAMIAAASVDGKSLDECERLVLLYATEEANSDMVLSADGRSLLKRGKAPALLRTGKIDITLKNSNASKMSLYALGFDGSRREQLPLSVKGDTLEIKIDTASLKDGPTPFFELSTK